MMEQNLRGSQSLRGSGDSPLPDRQGAGRSSYQPFRDAKMRKGPRSSYAGSEAGSLYSAQNSPRGHHTSFADPSTASSPTASTAGRQSFNSKAQASQDGRFGGHGENRMSQANGGVRKSQHMGNKRQAKVVNDLTSSWAENSVSIAEVHTHADKEHWEVAITRTREAEMEAARAKLAFVRAQRATAGARQLQSAADEQSQLHSQLMEKALLVKAEIDEADPAHFRAAEDAYRRALHDWENFSRGIAELEAEAKQAQHDYETHLPLMETHRKKGRQLTEDYDENIRVVRGASDNLPHLQSLVQPAHDRAHEAGYEVDALQVELSQADAACAPLEQPALEARRAHAALAQQLAIARENQAQAEHRHNTLLNSYRNACGLEQDINKRRAMLLEQMETGRAHLADMEARQEALRAAILDGEQRLPGLRAGGVGLPGQLDAAEKALQLQYTELEELQTRCMAAEASYKEAVAACNAEEAVGAEASQAAHSHMAAFEEQNRAFKLHEDNHAQLWHEAKEHGSLASRSATDILEKLHAMVRSVLPVNHYLAAEQ